tara:strand:+ start:226 stop:426 length:201 start_codon:yes stop_codon:yes gene_type:complete
MEIDMKIDFYSKVVMTVIAVALVKIALSDVSLIDPVSASSGNKVQMIAICDRYGNRCAGLKDGMWK